MAVQLLAAHARAMLYLALCATVVASVVAYFQLSDPMSDGRARLRLARGRIFGPRKPPTP